MHLGNNQEKRSVFSISGFVGGLLFGGLCVGIYYVKLSAAELNSTEILPLVIVWLVIGISGGFVGERMISKIGEWLCRIV